MIQSRFLILIALLGLSVSACATSPDRATANDPFEPFNRVVFDLNEGVDRAIVAPISRGYDEITPDPVQDSVRNVFRNLNRPVVLTNTLLQGDLGASGDVLASFALDTTVGLGGLLPVAERQGIAQHSEDFGQTLGVWGVPEGPYVMIPLLGPSNFRDGIGRVADRYPHPFNWNQEFSQSNEAWAARTVNGLQFRTDAETAFATLDRTAIDPYVQMRSAYRQSRNAQINNGNEADSVQDLPDFD